MPSPIATPKPLHFKCPPIIRPNPWWDCEEKMGEYLFNITLHCVWLIGWFLMLAKGRHVGSKDNSNGHEARDS